MRSLAAGTSAGYLRRSRLQRRPPHLARTGCRDRSRGLAKDAPISGQRLQPVAERRLPHLEAQPPRGLVLQVVCLVHDQDVVFRNQGASGGHVGQQQSVIHDHDV